MELSINGQTRAVPPDYENGALLWLLRDELGLVGTRFGCGAGFCGACTVHVDGQATRSCLTPVSSVVGQAIRTIEGLAEGETLHPVQEAFIELQVPQCAWCMSGQMMQAAAFLAQNPSPSEAEVVEAMQGNYCRCGCYGRIKAAVQLAAEKQEVA